MKTTRIIPFLTTIAISSFVSLSSCSSKSQPPEADSVISESSDEVEDTYSNESYYYTSDDSYEEEENYQAEDVQEEVDLDEIVDWVKATYGNDRYLSQLFKNVLKVCEDTYRNTGSLCGPDFSYWWWNQDPDEVLSVVQAKMVGDNQIMVEVEADGTTVFLQIIKENGNWVYNDFYDIDLNSYLKMMQIDAVYANKVEM